MSDFFRGWRRKIGVAMLMIALAMTSGWVRSYSVMDGYGFHPIQGKVVALLSLRGRVVCWLINGLSGYVVSADAFRGSWTLNETIEFESRIESTLSDHELTRRWRRFGFEFALVSGLGIVGDQIILIIPYWLLVLPITAISTYLLLFRATTNSVCYGPQSSPAITLQSE